MHYSLARRSFLLGAMAAASAAAGRAVGADLADASPYDLLMQGGRFLPYYLDVRRKFEAGELGMDQEASWVAAIVGDEKEALRFAGPSPMRPGPAVSPADLRATDALDAIEAAARGSRIVILNEAHHISRHRHFAGRVAERLALAGFTHFGAEAFAPSPVGTLFSIRSLSPGAPVTAKAGFYVADSTFAETVRAAMKAGLSLFEYEQRADQRASGTDPDAATAAREQAQAENVSVLLRQNPDAKIFIYCGYEHVTEVANERGRWFATHLKAMTGLDPVTVDQSQTWHRANANDDPLHIRTVSEAFRFSEPLSVIDGSGLAYTSRSYSGRVDISVFHPRLEDVNGRPGWLAADRTRAPLRIPMAPSDQMTLVQAYRALEGWGSLPADQTPVSPGAGDVTLYLLPGEYFVRREFADRGELLGRATLPSA